MKKLSKVLVLVLSAIMVLAMSASVFAETGNVGGKGSIKVLNATKGHDYKAYKIFDASFDGDKVSYKVEASKKDYVDTEYFNVSSKAETIDGKEYYSVSVKTTKDETTGEVTPVKTDEEIIQWMKDNYSKFDSTGVDGAWDTANSTVSFNQIPYGYYYITSTLGTAVTINSAKPNQDVYDKNEVTPTDPEKTIVSVDGEAVSDLKQADAHVGSVIGFKVTAKTTNWTGKESEAVITQNWAMEDTPTNMTIDKTTVVVKFNGEALAADAFTADLEGKTLKINVPMVDANGNSIYPAPKTTDATTNGLIPIEVTYTATVDTAAASAPATNEVGDSKVEVDTYMFELKKTDGTNELLGAQFEAYNGDTKLTFVKDGNSYIYSATGDVDVIDLTQVAVADIKGLDKTWDVTLKEITVPTGYNQADDQTAEGSKFIKATANAQASDYTVEVVNLQGAVLPSTGGIGTTIFYVLGSLLVVGCGIVLVSRKRMQNK